MFLKIDCRVFIGYDCGAFVCMISYFIMSDCCPLFNQGDMEIMRRRITLMIMRTSCRMIEDPINEALILNRQNDCDEHMHLYRALRKSCNKMVNTKSQNQQRSSVTVEPQSVIRLQEALESRFINDGNAVQCRMVGCVGQQALKIGIEKMPGILVIDIAATVVEEGHTMPVTVECIEDVVRNLTVQGTKYALVQVILHNGSHYRGVTVLSNQNVLYDGKFCNGFRSIADTERFASKEMGQNYRVSCLWYRKVLNSKESASNPLPAYPPFAEMTQPEEEKQHRGGAAEEITPKNEKRTSKPKKRYTPPDQSTPNPPKRRKKNKSKRDEKSALVDAVASRRYHDPVGISIRKGKEFGPVPLCQHCKNGIPHDRWRVINRVKRKGKGYDVKQLHIFHAKLALSDDEFEQLVRLLKSSSDTEIKQLRSAWIQSMHQGMGKGAETGAARRSSLEWFSDFKH